jgi:polysaccharide biosynthesis transport protein
LPYFLVIFALISAIAVTAASILPPVYRSTASILVENQQIPGNLAASTVPVNPIEQIQIIQQRLMTRANLLSLAERFDIYAGHPGMSADAIVADMRSRALLRPQGPGRGPGVTMIEVSFASDSPQQSAEVTNEIATLILRENVSIRTDRASDTLGFFEEEVDRLSGELDRMSERIAVFRRENQDALPDSLGFRRNQQALLQERLLQLEREAASLQDNRERVQRIYERTGRVTLAAQPGTPEEGELTALRRELSRAQAIYSSTNPNIRLLETRIAALERVVEAQRAEMGDEFEGMSEIDIELAQIDGRLDFITQERERLEAEVARLEESIRATAPNELALAGLERDLRNVQAQYDSAVGRLGQAAVGERIEVMSKGERFSLVEPAVPPGAPEQPNRLLIAGGGVAGGLAAGLGFIVLLELLNRSIRRPSELNSRLGIPAFATIPYIRTRRETLWKRTIVGGVLALIFVGIPAGLFALHTYYLPLDLMLRRLLEKAGLTGVI